MGQQKRIRTAIAVFAALLFAQTAQAGGVSLSWDPSTDSVAGYIVQYGTESGVYTGAIDVGTLTSATIAGLDAGQTYYFVVAAYDNTGETSAPSPTERRLGDPPLLSSRRFPPMADPMSTRQRRSS